MKYSPSTGGFYLPAIHGNKIPADAVEIGIDRHRELMEAQGQGMVIVAGEGGYPITVPRDTLVTPEDAMASLRIERDRLLAASDWTQIPDAPLDEESQATWSAYRQALRDLPDTVQDAKSPHWPTPPSKTGKDPA